MGSGPALVPGASTRLQHQTILDNHRPASPTNAPAQFFGPHVACHVRGGRFLIAGAPMLREHSGKSRALQGGRLSRRRSRILGSGRWGAECGAAGEEGQQQQASAHLCLGGRPHTFPCCVQATSAQIQISHFGTHPHSTYVLNLVSFILKVLCRLVLTFFGSLQRKVTE